MEEGLIAREQLFQVGIRATWGHCEEDAPSRAHGARIYRADEVASTGSALVARHILQKVGNRPLYITFDVDGLDPAFAPGTGTPVPGGLSTREALTLLRGLAGARIIGMDVVEVAPNLDHADMTCHLAAHLLFEGLALAAIAKRTR
jgi:agmatinase